jgi:hypothetical protein
MYVGLLVCTFRVRDYHRKKYRLPITHVRYGVHVRSSVTMYGTVRYGTVRYQYQYRLGTVLYCTVRYRTVWYIYRTVLYRNENLEILERGEADPI